MKLVTIVHEPDFVLTFPEVGCECSISFCEIEGRDGYWKKDWSGDPMNKDYCDYHQTLIIEIARSIMTYRKFLKEKKKAE